MSQPLAPPVPLPAWQPAAPRAGALAGVVLLHLVVLALLWHTGRQVAQAFAPAPLSVRLLERPTPPSPPRLPPTAAEPGLRAEPIRMPLPVVPAPDFVTLAPPRDGPGPTALASPPAAPALTPPDSLPRAISPAPPQPKPVGAGSLRYRVEPAVEVPRLSRRAGESGRVQLRVVFDVEGRPRHIELARSSGFARLDAQALEAMQAARIQPYQEDGRAIEVVAVATLEYELN